MATPAPVDPQAFRRLMARWPTGVSVVTSHHDRVDAGLTVNAFLSISLTPPRVLVSVAHDADTTPHLRASGSFAVNVLAADQRELSERFARAEPSPQKFVGLPIHRGITGAALLEGTLAAMECRILQEVEAGDHSLYIGDVVRSELGLDREPLLFYHSRYAEVTAPSLVRLPPPRE